MKPYAKKITKDDAKHARLQIDQDEWPLFPRPGEKSRLVFVGGKAHPAKVIGEKCECRPPPHEHRYLEVGEFAQEIGLAPGKTIRFSARADGGLDLAVD